MAAARHLNLILRQKVTEWQLAYSGLKFIATPFMQ